MKLKKIGEEYSAYSKNGEFYLRVEVKTEMGCSHIRSDFGSDTWRSKEETIAYLEWCIARLEELPEQVKELGKKQ